MRLEIYCMCDQKCGSKPWNCNCKRCSLFNFIYDDVDSNNLFLNGIDGIFNEEIKNLMAKDLFT